jgi:hypothetical protein
VAPSSPTSLFITLKEQFQQACIVTLPFSLAFFYCSFRSVFGENHERQLDTVRETCNPAISTQHPSLVPGDKDNLAPESPFGFLNDLEKYVPDCLDSDWGKKT